MAEESKDRKIGINEVEEVAVTLTSKEISQAESAWIKVAEEKTVEPNKDENEEVR